MALPAPFQKYSALLDLLVEQLLRAEEESELKSPGAEGNPAGATTTETTNADGTAHADDNPLPS
jgi:hypothetical protein